MGPWLRWYYAVKYRPFRRERRAPDRQRGLVVLQIDALAYADLRRAIRLGYCPTIARLLRDAGFQLRRWFCGLPSATPYCQAGILYGVNDGIPAFRFYDKGERRVITCNTPHGVQYIRDRIGAPGALAGGSSYVNLLDGDAETVAFTVATRRQLSIYQRLGGTRMALLAALHPIRMARMVVQSVFEWVREEWQRTVSQWRGRATHTEGMFPFVRILCNVIVRELQTLAIMLDVYLRVPVIYSTYMQYDELAHHFGPASPEALADLRRTDARVREIWRMIRATSGRRYDLVILSDHGMTPAVSYRVRFAETLGTTVKRVLREDGPGHVHASASTDSEYADAGPQIVEAVAGMARAPHRRWERLLGSARDWLRRQYGLRELILPEKYAVDPGQDVVVTYSSCLALLYFADDPRALDWDDVHGDPRRLRVHESLLAHPGVGLIATRTGAAVRVAGRDGLAVIEGDTVRVLRGENPLAIYGTEPRVASAVRALVQQPNAGDLVLFGAYDGYEIVSFDDQVGAHGAAGGEQTYPFLITPGDLDLRHATLSDARDIHGTVLRRYRSPEP